MNTKWRRIALTLFFAGTLGMLASGCVIRASGSVRAKPVYVVDAPPPKPRYVRVKPRAGHVWVRGHYQHVNGRWVWRNGRWKRARTGHHWKAGHWERRGNRWHWIEGQWVAGGGVRVRERRHSPAVQPARPVVRSQPAAPSPYPTNAPPPLRAESPGQRAGFVWVRGHWEWRNGRWKWKPGVWKRVRTGFRWVPGHWEQRGNRYVWVAGQWEQATDVRDHRRKKRKTY